jgi:hypothetical protein
LNCTKTRFAVNQLILLTLTKLAQILLGDCYGNPVAAELNRAGFAGGFLV